MPTTNPKETKPGQTDLVEKAIERPRTSLIAYLETFPGGEFDRNPSPSRHCELSEATQELLSNPISGPT